MNDAQTTKIREALKQLDISDNSHWTEDGLPRTGTVQKIANDQTITRQTIQAAWPGFQRTPVVGKPVTPAPTPTEAPLSGAIDASADPALNEGEPMTEDEVREILNQRVVDALGAENAAQDKIKDGQRELIEARKQVQIARNDFQREFPPKTAAQNIKEYLASELARRAADAGVSPSGLSGAQIDNAMQRSNSRGWRRPARGTRPTVTSGLQSSAA